MTIFCWNQRNIEHIATHGVVPEEAEEVIQGAMPPFPRDHGDEKYLVCGQTDAGRYLQVIYIIPSDEDVDVDALGAAELPAFSDGTPVIYVIHAMEMTDRQKKQYRKQRGAE